MDHTAIAHATAGMQNSIGVQLATFSYLHIPVDHHARLNDVARPDACVVTDADMGGNAHASAELHAIGNHSAGVNA